MLYTWGLWKWCPDQALRVQASSHTAKVSSMHLAPLLWLPHARGAGVCIWDVSSMASRGASKEGNVLFQQYWTLWTQGNAMVTQRFINLIYFWKVWSLVIITDSKSLACLQRYSTPLSRLMEQASRDKSLLADLILQKNRPLISPGTTERHAPGPQLVFDQVPALPWFQILLSSSPAPGTDNDPVLELGSTRPCDTEPWAQGTRRSSAHRSQLQAYGGCILLQTY